MCVLFTANKLDSTKFNSCFRVAALDMLCVEVKLIGACEAGVPLEETGLMAAMDAAVLLRSACTCVKMVEGRDLLKSACIVCIQSKSPNSA